MNAIGIDIGGTAVKLAALDASGATLWTARSDSYERPTTGQLVSAIREAAAGRQAGARPAVGLCVPGILNEARTAVRQAVNVPGLVGERLDELVATAFGTRVRNVSVATDAIATALDLYASRRLRGRLFLLAIGTGVGAAVLDDGRPLLVDGDSPGHFGQMDVSTRPNPAVGPDGGAGSMEAYLSGPALARWYESDQWEDRVAVDDVPMQALVRAIRIAHAMFRPHHVCLAGGVGIRLGRTAPALRAAVANRLTNIARADWTLSVGDSEFHAAQGAARLALASLGGAGHAD